MKLARRTTWPAPVLGAIGLLVGLTAALGLAGPRVVGFSPSENSLHVSTAAPVRIRFNQAMDRASVESRLSIEPRLPGRIEWAHNELVFYPLDAWQAGSQVTVRLAAGARSARILPSLWGYRWSFQVDHPRLVYLSPSGGGAQLYAQPIPQGEARALTEVEAGVLDYDVSADGEAIAYTALRDDGGSDLRLLALATGEDRLAYSCPPDTRCQGVRLDPEGGRIVFERMSWDTGAGGRRVPGRTQVWVLELASGSEPLLISPPDHHSETPSWSPTGLLAYYDASLSAVSVVDPRQAPQPSAINLIPNRLGLMGSFTPEGAYLLLPEILFPQAEADADAETASQETGPDFYSHVLKVNLLTGAASDLSGDPETPVEDSSPAHSPDGLRVAFARRFLDDRWTLGRQAWLMDSSGSQAVQLTFNSDYHHFSFVWSQDARYLAFVRLNQNDLAQPPEILVLDLQIGSQAAQIEDGLLPRWIP